MTTLGMSVVVPVFNEEGALREFYSRLRLVISVMKVTSEILFINDGSSDSSAVILEELRRADPQVRVLSFTRNFGHQVAVKAGLDHAQGDTVVIIDADLQDPPELIPALWAKWREGYEVVYVLRVQREGESFFKKFTAALYYNFLQKIATVDIPRNTGDFRLISRQVADVLKNIHEKNPYLRGLVAWTGFKSVGVPVKRQPRFAGKTSYTLKKMIHLAWSGITHFSFFPLQLAGMFGLLSLAAAVAFLLRIILGLSASRNFLDTDLILFSIFFLGGIQLLCAGILGGYLGCNYDQTRSRPLYILKKE